MLEMNGEQFEAHTLAFNPLTAAAQYIPVFIFYWVPCFKHVKGKNNVTSISKIW